MKYTVFFFILFFYFISFQSTTLAAGSTSAGEHSIYNTIHNGKEKPSSSTINDVGSTAPSLFPVFIKFIVSFVLVIGLLLFLLRFLSKRSRMMQSSGPVLPLGGHMLGNNRSLQVVLIGQTIYIVGVGEDITLIRSISQGEEYQHLLESYENQGDALSQKWFMQDSKTMWNSVFRKYLQKIHQENGEE